MYPEIKLMKSIDKFKLGMKNEWINYLRLFTALFPLTGGVLQ